MLEQVGVKFYHQILVPWQYISVSRVFSMRFVPIHLSDHLVLTLYIEKSKSKNDGSNEPAGSTNISSTEYWESKFCSMKWPTR
jgi:hypothetical protein